MKALVLAAARSRKLAPFSDSRPKTMINMAGQTILARQLSSLKAAGVTEVSIVVGHQSQMIEDSFGFGRDLGLKIDYLHQKENLGIGNAVYLAKDFLAQDERFLLVYADALMAANPFKSLVERSKQQTLPNIATVSHPSSEGAYGNVYLSGDMTISRLIEKPEVGRYSNYIFGGSFILEGSIFDRLEKAGQNMLSVFQSLIEEKQIEASLWEDSWMDISRPWDILLANQMLLKELTHSIVPNSVQIDRSVNIQGPVVFGENVHIAAGSSITGPCYIGDNCYIGNSCLIRHFSSIGAGCTIGYGTEVKNSVLFGDAKIGRLSFVGDSVLGQKVSLGSGTMTINHNITGENVSFHPENEPAIDTGLEKLGAFIGDDAKIGTGHNLAPGSWIQGGAIIPDHFTFQNKNQ